MITKKVRNVTKKCSETAETEPKKEGQNTWQPRAAFGASGHIHILSKSD